MTLCHDVIRTQSLYSVKRKHTKNALISHYVPLILKDLAKKMKKKRLSSRLKHFQSRVKLFSMINTDYLERDRMSRGVTQKEFASMLDMSPSSYARIIREKSAHATTIAKIVNRLKLDRDILIPETQV